MLSSIRGAHAKDRAGRAALALLIGPVITIGALGATTGAGQPQTAVGERKPLGSGVAYSWMRTATDGSPAAIGVSFDDAALQQLGSDGKEVVLAVPPAPGSTARNVVIDWNPHGHPPAHVYDVPHFDFHVYSIDEATRMAIGPTGPAADATPPPDIVPAGFSGGQTVPMMGRHYTSAAQPEFHHGTFTATPICGYWDGHLTFFESMITLEYLQTHPSLSAPFPQPARFEGAGWYPNRYGVAYDAAAHRYDVTFSK